MAERRNEKYSLTSEDFDGLLAALNSDSDRAGQMYQDIRDHLIRIFVWRGCSEAEDYADETINRVARKLSRRHNDKSRRTVHAVAAVRLASSVKEFMTVRQQDLETIR